MNIARRLEQLALHLPPAPQPPPGVVVPFQWVRVYGQTAYVSGHGPQNRDGSFLSPGKVGGELTVEQGYEAARLATLAILGSLLRTLGDLDRIAAWLSVAGHVTVTPGFNHTTRIINGCSDLLLDVFGQDTGAHARTAIGVAELPLGLPVVISAQVALR